jgi:hypothetical protein
MGGAADERGGGRKGRVNETLRGPQFKRDEQDERDCIPA